MSVAEEQEGGVGVEDGDIAPDALTFLLKRSGGKLFGGPMLENYLMRVGNFDALGVQGFLDGP